MHQQATIRMKHAGEDVRFVTVRRLALVKQVCRFASRSDQHSKPTEKQSWNNNKTSPALAPLSMSAEARHDHRAE